jgi:membrane fusion protein, multidrug efflux system
MTVSIARVRPRDMRAATVLPRHAVWLAGGMLAAFGLAACGGGGDAGNPQVANAQAGAVGGQAQPGGTGGGGGGMGGRGGMSREPIVEVAQAERGTIAREVTVSGVVEPIRMVGVNSQLAGAVLSVHAEEGVVVRPGTVLARLDDRELRAQLEAAEAAYQVAASSYRRAEQLRERRVITLPEYERERTAYAAARAQLDQIRTRIGFATVTSPIAGVVTEKRVEFGDIVGNQTRLFTIADISTMVVRVGVSELDVVAIREGDGARIALDAYAGRELRGRVRRIFPSADPGTRLVPVEVALESNDAARPGFLARVTFGVGARDNVLLVPASAVLQVAGGQAVFVIEDGRAVRRTVETGGTAGGRVEIVSGLVDGETVVTVGNHALRDGATVRVVGTEPRATAGHVAERSGT